METDAAPIFSAEAYDPQARLALRRTAQLAAGKPATRDHLRQALAQAEEPNPTPAKLRFDPSLVEVLERAFRFAAERSGSLVGRDDLAQASLEAEAVAAGLDLNRLRAVRCYVQRYRERALSRRRYRDGEVGLSRKLEPTLAPSTDRPADSLEQARITKE